MDGFPKKFEVCPVEHIASKAMFEPCLDYTPLASVFLSAAMRSVYTSQGNYERAKSRLQDGSFCRLPQHSLGAEDGGRAVQAAARGEFNY